MRLLCATVLSLFVVLGSRLGAAPAEPGGDANGRPNLVLIMSDDMGFSDIGCYGGEIATPTLDRLAANGLRFSQFYNTGRCCPTRASLLTGLYAHQAGVGHMMGDYGLPQYQGELNRRCVTIAEALKPAGYRTYMAGKWHVTPYRAGRNDAPDTANWPRQRGFDRFYGTIHGAGSFYDPNSLTRDNRHVTPDNDPDYQPETFYYTDAISDNAVRFLSDHRREADGQPFFMYVAYTAAHWPMHALPEDVAKHEGKYDGGYAPAREARVRKLRSLGLLPDEWEVVPQAGDWEMVGDKEWEAACMEVYAAMIDNMDRGIGRIVHALEESGQLDNTLLLYFQDNGGCAETFGRGERVGPLERPAAPTLPPMDKDALQTQMVPPQSRDGYPLRRGEGVIPGPPETQIGYGRGWANVSNTPFREYKHWVHEGGIATPLIAHWPRGIEGANRWFRTPAHLIDLMATCLDLAGAEYPAEYRGERIIPLEGISLRPAFEGGDLARGKPIFWEHEGNRAVRDGKWKLVAKGVKGGWELYDMEADRTEMHDLAATHPDLVATMAKRYEQWAEERGVVPFGSWNDKGDRKRGGSKKQAFQLKAGDALPSEQSPAIAGRSFTVSATVNGLPAQGVIAAQGGSSLGWSLYVQNEKLHFVTRNGGELHRVSATLPEGSSCTVSGEVTGDMLTLAADGNTLAVAKCKPMVGSHPIDGLEVGRDEKGLVGDYGADNEFEGEVEAVTIELN